jgi:hypothetical protein
MRLGPAQSQQAFRLGRRTVYAITSSGGGASNAVARFPVEIPAYGIMALLASALAGPCHQHQHTRSGGKAGATRCTEVPKTLRRALGFASRTADNSASQFIYGESLIIGSGTKYVLMQLQMRWLKGPQQYRQVCFYRPRTSRRAPRRAQIANVCRLSCQPGAMQQSLDLRAANTDNQTFCTPCDFRA